MYLIYEAEYLVGTGALTTTQSNGYKDVAWQMDVKDDKVFVTRLLAVEPSQQGSEAATSALE